MEWQPIKIYDEMKALLEMATPGPWSHHEPGCCRSIMYRDGVICEMMNDQVDMADATGCAPTRTQSDVNMQLIVSVFNVLPALISAAEALKPFAEPPEDNLHSGPAEDYDKARAALAALGE